MATIFSSDQKQYERWKRSGPKPTKLADAELEAAIMRLAREYPDNIIRGTV